MLFVATHYMQHKHNIYVRVPMCMCQIAVHTLLYIMYTLYTCIYAEIFEQISALNRISSHLMCYFPLFEYPLSFHITCSHSGTARFCTFFCRCSARLHTTVYTKGKNNEKTICSLTHQVILLSHILLHLEKTLIWLREREREG